MPRFVILTHDWPTLHWDLLLEAGAALKSWRLLAEPTPGEWVPAEPMADHRRAYLDYEGPVSGGRGSVARYDWGEFAGELGASWEVRWQGQRGAGVARLAGGRFGVKRDES